MQFNAINLYNNPLFKRLSSTKKNGFFIKGIMIQRGLELGYGMNVPIIKYEYNGKHYQNKVRFTYLTILPRKIGHKYKILVDPEKPSICIFDSKTVVSILIFNQILFLIGAILFLFLFV